VVQQSGLQVSGGAAERYERYAVQYFRGPWAPGSSHQLLCGRPSACWTSHVAPGSWHRTVVPFPRCPWDPRAVSDPRLVAQELFQVEEAL